MNSPNVGFVSRCLYAREVLAVLGLASVGCGGASVAPPVSPAARPASGPSAADVWSVADDDCPAPLTRFADADGDGAGDAAVEVSICTELAGFVADDSDCDDLRPDVAPGAVEVCGDGLDNNCDGTDLACAPPDLDTDAVALSRAASDDEFGFVVVGGLRTTTDGSLAAVFGAPAAESSPGAEDDAGLLLQLSGLETDAGGDDLSFADRTTGEIAGVPDARLGRALARSSTLGDGEYDRLYVGTGGTINVGGDDVECAVAWFDDGLPASGDISSDASGSLHCGGGAPSSTFNGIESLAMGFWDDTGEVLAAPRITRDYMYVVATPADSGAATLSASGLRVNDVDNEALGHALVWADLDGDGLDDLIAGTPERDMVVSDGGGFDILPGADLQLYALGTEYDVRSMGLGIALDRADENHGVAITAGDLTGDGQPEVIVGSFEEDSASPASVVVVSVGDFAAYGGQRLGLTDVPASTEWTRLSSSQVGDLYGFSVAWLTNGGLVVGAAGWDAAGAPEVLDGRVYAYAPDPTWFDSTDHVAEDVAVATISAGSSGDAIGIGLADGGDINGDGATDLWLTSFGLSSGETHALLLLNTGL